jgi:HSP20 family molecular chaperone IbpA
MSFWNINIDDWIRGRLYLDENISAYRFHTTTWYSSNNSLYNRYSEFNDIIESYDADLREKDLLEEFRDIIPHHSIQEWPQELMIEEYQTISEEQTHLEPFVSPYYYYFNAIPKVSGKEGRKKIREFKKSPNSHLNSYANDDVITYAYRDSDVLYSEDKEVVKGKGDYPIEITRSNELIRITTQIPFVDDKNNIKVKIYDDNSIEISIDDAHSLNNNKYYRIVEVPKDADIETARCTCRNGVMEITFKQKNTVSD